MIMMQLEKAINGNIRGGFGSEAGWAAQQVISSQESHRLLEQRVLVEGPGKAALVNSVITLVLL